ncbi:type IV pilus biogenesis protein PilP [Paraburkholderia aromaticivorans]|uniref:type IV pilus biogenesis protein PilP n=1 Tax=Paraburkholderia aromaticivorans TaxID=2026199 RepID=UPI00197D6C3D|nr:type IV pilus biogenesis protein PilP [Paraburkholderia aromaticivorans]
MNTYQRTIAIALATLVSGGALAASPSATPGSMSTAPVPVSEIPELLANEQAQTPLLIAKATNAKLRADIKQLEQGPNAAGGTAPAAGLTSLIQPLAKSRKDPGDVALVSVGGADGSYRAYLSVDGRTVIAEVGDTIDNGWKVLAIGSSSVRLSNGKQQRTLRI